MATTVLIYGQSGSGKSTSMRNFEPSDISVFSVTNKPLPFRKKLPVLKSVSYQQIYDSLAKAAQSGKLKPAYMIDDAGYLMTFANFARTNETGYKKYTDFALDFYNLLKWIQGALPDDVIVYLTMHENLEDNGKVKAKTVGKMLDSQLCLEGLFTIVLHSEIQNGNYKFVTQSDGNTVAKSPIDMFETVVDNDLKKIDSSIREYYGFTNNNTNTQEATNNA